MDGRTFELIVVSDLADSHDSGRDARTDIGTHDHVDPSPYAHGTCTDHTNNDGRSGTRWLHADRKDDACAAKEERLGDERRNEDDCHVSKSSPFESQEREREISWYTVMRKLILRTNHQGSDRVHVVTKQFPRRHIR